MPKGVYPHTHIKPKSYPPDVVARVASLYEGGSTQTEIAVSLGMTQKMVWRIMKNHGLRARVAAKRNQRGPNNDSWKERVGYQALHCRVYALRGKPQKCEECGTTAPNRHYDWANLTGNYDDPRDYKRMCRKCHRAYDGRRRKEVRNAR